MAGEPTGCDDPRDVERGRRLNELFDRRLRAGGAPAATPEEMQTAAGDSSRAGSEARPAATAGAEFSGELRECLDALAAVRAEVATLGTLVAQGVLARSVDPRYAAELGPYKIVRFIGRGGMGLVFEAYEENLDRSIALKLLRPELAVDAAALARFEREAKAAAALRHPNIVTVYAIGQEGATRYIAMEYVAGASLAEVIRGAEGSRDQGSAGSGGGGEAISYQLSATGQGTRDQGSKGSRGGKARGIVSSLTSGTIRRIFRELLLGLDAAHKAGLIHRDIKSANILLDRTVGEGSREQGIEGSRSETAPHLDPLIPGSLDPFVKIADFGLARMRSSQTQMTVDGSVLGTPEYMSPEQARGEDVDPRTDLYSAGVVLYEMLTGRTPFKADTPTATIRRILDEEPPDPRKLDKRVDPVLASLALRLMAKRREERFASAGEVLCALDAGIRVPQLRSRHQRWSSQWTVRIGVLAMGVAICSAGFWYWSARRAPIYRVAVAQDKRAVHAYYGLDTAPKLFFELPADAPTTINAAELLADEQIVAVGLGGTLRGANLLLVDLENSRQPRQLDLSGKYDWPNCLRKADDWAVACLVSTGLRGPSTPALVAAATNRGEYPARVSLIEPRSRDVRMTFWHFGNIKHLQVIPGFFAGPPTRPAIVAWGLNNKLDGFYDDTAGQADGPAQELAGDDPPRTKWDAVSVVMILDPAAMNGLGPPRTTRMQNDIAATDTAFAYAYLDLAPTVEYGCWDANQQARRFPDAGDIGEIRGVALEPSSSADDEMAVLRVGIARHPADPDHPGDVAQGGVTLYLDRNLAVKSDGVVTGLGRDGDEVYWRERWHPIIQNYRYVDKPAAVPVCAPAEPATDVTSEVRH